MEKIEKLVWEHLKFEMTHGGTALSKTKNGIILTFRTVSNTKSLAVIRLLSVLDKKGLGHFFDGDLRIIISPNVTLEDKINLAEIKASCTGTKVLKHQEQMIVLLAGFKDALQELNDLKQQLKAEKGEAVEAI